MSEAGGIPSRTIGGVESLERPPKASKAIVLPYFVRALLI